MTSILPLLRTCRVLSGERILRIAVFGRFKAGKSTFLNHLIGRNLVPTGVTPVTSAITEVGYGVEERAAVRYLDGRETEIPLDQIRSFIAESENPENRKSVAMVLVDLPSLHQYKGIRFVDTPGLDSVFAHNTEASLSWLPNVGLALVAIGVDPPLSQQDIALIRKLYDFTPRVTVLLTKLDVLSAADQDEVRSFVAYQLRRNFENPPAVVPYSVRPEYQYTQEAIEDMILSDVLGRFNEQRDAVVRHKMTALLRECRDYLALALKSAEALDSERSTLKKMVLGERASLEEFKTQLKLVTRHAAAGSRDMVSKCFEPERPRVEKELTAALESEYPIWAVSVARAIEGFESWLGKSLDSALSALSAANRKMFAEYVEKLRNQLARSLQDFRARLSERTSAAFGIPLRITEIEIEAKLPRSPDIKVGKVFDRNWELLSWVIPIGLVGGLMRGHLIHRVLPFEVFKNFSRITSQWEESINAALFDVEKQALTRLDDLMGTIESLLSRATSDAPEVATDLRRIEEAEQSLVSKQIDMI
ncbi:MAG TPA: dynamin family protein [Candidatus Sulfotelmatobacter sp.]|nr:dynamin family protein [Candidatus Sulfotelmatobacter sp.]